jgi:hypothetical protein
MNLREAWDATAHGRAMRRQSGERIEKWVGEKPNLPPGFDRYVRENADTIGLDNIMATDWEPEA